MPNPVERFLGVPQATIDRARADLNLRQVHLVEQIDVDLATACIGLAQARAVLAHKDSTVNRQAVTDLREALDVLLEMRTRVTSIEPQP